MRVVTLITGGLTCGAIGLVCASEPPLVPPSLCVSRIFVAELATARRWLEAIDDESAGRAIPDVGGAELGGVDEADLVALYMVVTGANPEAAAGLMREIEHGHHGYLRPAPKVMVKAFSKADATWDVLMRFNETATRIRGAPKAVYELQLSLHDIRRVARVSSSAGSRRVFIHFSE